MENLLASRDRLLRRTARFSGLSFTTLSALCILIPSAIPQWALLVVIPLFAILATCQGLAGFQQSLYWPLGTIISGLSLIVTISLVSPTAPTAAAITAIESLGAAAIASVAIVLTATRWRRVLLGGAFFVVVTVTHFFTYEWENPLRASGLVVLGWSLSVIVALWIVGGVPSADRRIRSIGLAHQAQRAASDVEAQRRQAARLLHDTVLSTLTLLAHSGVGVSPAALKHQAAEDARLLRQLRLGGTPVPLSSGDYSLEQAGAVTLGTTLTAVKQKFGRMGLVVQWHGSGDIHLPPLVRDAFLLALAECLENVRRHSGVFAASVTIIDDPSTVRAIVTDAGCGFVVDDVDPAKLGLAESVVARIREVDGQVRIFSAVGSGTTVVLEVPR